MPASPSPSARQGSRWCSSVRLDAGCLLGPRATACDASLAWTGRPRQHGNGQVSTDAVSRMRRCAVPSFTARDLDELCFSPHHEQVILAGAGMRLTHHE